MKLFAAYITLILLTGSLANAERWDLSIYSEQYPPFNFSENNNEAKGVTVDLLKRILVDIDREDLIEQIRFVPWARGYHYVTTAPNILLFAMARNPEREQLFHWVGPIMTTNFVLIGKQSLLDKFGGELTLEDITKLKVIVIKNDVGELILRQRKELTGISKEVVSTPTEAAKMLHFDRVDLWCYGIEAVQFIMKREGFDYENYQIIYPLDTQTTLYYAFSQQTPLEIVEQFQQSLDRMKMPDETGVSVLDQILINYGISPNKF
ncbi:MAG: transporter substrate-binding domain-containing protein [Reinekea sp.]|jgi:polar amino acid transport system substrate-binding protein